MKLKLTTLIAHRLFNETSSICTLINSMESSFLYVIVFIVTFKLSVRRCTSNTRFSGI